MLHLRAIRGLYSTHVPVLLASACALEDDCQTRAPILLNWTTAFPEGCNMVNYLYTKCMLQADKPPTYTSVHCMHSSYVHRDIILTRWHGSRVSSLY